MNPEWSDFKILIALSRGGSVAGAAREMGLDASTVSRRLAALEDSVGTRLIVRGGREFGWTTEGRAALSAAEGMNGLVSGAIRTCREAKLEASGTVRVSMPPAFVAVVLGRMIPGLREKYPSLKLDMSADFRRVDLARGEADIAVRMARPTEPDLIARHSFEAGWCVYASVSYAGTRGMPASVKELRDHHLILYHEAMHIAEPLRWLETYRGTDFLRVDNLEMAAQLIAIGSGIGLLPTCFDATAPGLLRVFPEPVISNTGYLVYHESAREIARVRTAVDALVEFFDGQRPLFSGIPS